MPNALAVDPWGGYKDKLAFREKQKQSDIKNALSMENINLGRERNALMRERNQGTADYRQRNMVMKNAVYMTDGINKALKSRSPEEFDTVMNSYFPDRAKGPKIDFGKTHTSITFPDGMKMGGTREALTAIGDVILRNPNAIQDPKFWNIATSNGVQIEAPKPKEPKETSQDKINRAITVHEKTREFDIENPLPVKPAKPLSEKDEIGIDLKLEDQFAKATAGGKGLDPVSLETFKNGFGKRGKTLIETQPYKDKWGPMNQQANYILLPGKLPENIPEEDFVFTLKQHPEISPNELYRRLISK